MGKLHYNTDVRSRVKTLLGRKNKCVENEAKVAYKRISRSGGGRGTPIFEEMDEYTVGTLVFILLCSVPLPLLHTFFSIEKFPCLGDTEHLQSDCR